MIGLSAVVMRLQRGRVAGKRLPQTDSAFSRELSAERVCL